MPNEMMKLYEKFDTLRFPPLGKQLGDFALYEALFAGIVSRYMAGEKIDIEKIPIPDEMTSEAVVSLRIKKVLDFDEQEFLEYFDLMEKLQQLICSSL